LPFGETWITEGDKKNAPKYNSQELDKETGFYFYNARHYDPEICRFVTADTVVDGEKKDENGRIITSDTQGWNRYSYVKNNPIAYRDPTGHEAQPMGLDLSKGFNALAEKANNTLNTVKSSLSNAYESIKQTVSDKLQQAKNSITERSGGQRNSASTNNNQPGQSLLQTDPDLNPDRVVTNGVVTNSGTMANEGCYFRSLQATAEKYTGKKLSADAINAARDKLTKNGAIGGKGVSPVYVGNPDEVINDAFKRLGVKKTATVGYGGEPGQKRNYTILAGNTVFPSGASGDHKRLGDANANEIWDPAPGGNKSTSRIIDVFIHDKK
jgi:RHS repeat-associated protein